MSKKLLITFGCSWTFGVGAIWHPNIEKTTYNLFAFDADACFKYSFRNLLCQEFNLENKNFSEGGSSNQRQFRYAKEYFGSDEFKQDLDTFEQIIVFHGITDTGRNEFYSLEFQQLINMQYAMDKTSKFMHTDFQLMFSEFMIKHSYDHDHEVKQLDLEMKFWNTFYKGHKIKNIWIDTFNHHNYPTKIHNLFGSDKTNRDLLSQLAYHNGWQGLKDDYHRSVWANDCARVDFLIKKKILNPISKHPTAEGHSQLFDIIKDFFIDKL